MKFIEIIKILEEWAPRDIAWERDNTGLQTGDTEGDITNIFLSLELDDRVIDEAIRKNCNIIITHHPLIFNPIKKLNFKEKIPKLISRLIKNDITLYCAHTNLDYTKDGVSFQLAKVLGLQNISFLKNLSSNQYKLNVFVPENAVSKVSEAIFNSGGGIIGEYSKCSFRTSGHGTFKGSDKTIPSIGEAGEFKITEEIKLEVLVDKWKLNKVMTMITDVHPYEEPTFDIVPLDNIHTKYGIGAFGFLEREMEVKEFIDYAAEKLKLKNFRFSYGSNSKIRKVAVCGGSGIEYMNSAIANKCEAYITADIKYHSFQDGEGKILLIDAGHYETEIFAIKEIENRLNKVLPDEIKVHKYSSTTNPINFYKN